TNDLIEQHIKVTEWQQMYTYVLGIHSGANTCVPSVSSKGIVEEDKACGRQYTLKKTTTCTQAVPQSQGLCLAFVESDFNITKANENTDGSFDYGIFQINSHDWCRNYQSHTENPCHVDCQALAGAPGWERVKCRLHCAGRPLSCWRTGCHVG
ncbi:Lysozyme-like protein 6, partial [Camelus dromedarius]